MRATEKIPQTLCRIDIRERFTWEYAMLLVNESVVEKWKKKNLRTFRGRVWERERDIYLRRTNNVGKIKISSRR